MITVGELVAFFDEAARLTPTCMLTPGIRVSPLADANHPYDVLLEWTPCARVEDCQRAAQTGLWERYSGADVRVRDRFVGESEPLTEDHLAMWQVQLDATARLHTDRAVRARMSR